MNDTLDPPVAQMLLEGAQDAVKAFKLLRMAVAYDPKAVALCSTHIGMLEYAIAKAALTKAGDA